MSDLADIIARLEKATGPDRQLDRLIEETRPDVRRHIYQHMVDDGYVLEANGVQAYLPPHYTASLDAALTLVPEGLPWLLMRRGNNTHQAEVGDEWQYQGATPALALCIAALKARALTQPDRRGQTD